MANQRAIAAKRIPFFRRGARGKAKIPSSRIAKKHDWYPSFVTNVGSSAADNRAACPNTLVLSSPMTGCRITAAIELLPSTQVERYNDNVTVVAVHADYWWKMSPNGGNCSESNTLAWHIGTMYKDSNTAGGGFTHSLNPWDTSDLTAGTVVDQLFAEGDFTASPRPTYLQYESISEAKGNCTFGQDLGTMTYGSGTLVTGSGTIGATAGVFDVLTGTQGVEESSTKHERIRWRGRASCVKNDALLLQLDWADPYQGGDPPEYDIVLFGRFKVLLELP